MKNNFFSGFSTLLLLVSLIFVSCGSDDSNPQPINNAPNAVVVSTIGATVTEGTNVRVSWGATTDPDGDSVTYDVIVNGVTVGADLTETQVSFEGLQFVNNTAGRAGLFDAIRKSYNLPEIKRVVESENENKPDKNFKQQARTNSVSQENTSNVLVSLTIQIVVKDLDGETATSETSANVNLNRNPEAFDISSFMFYSYGFELVWYPTTDLDDEAITYNVYIEDDLYREDFVDEQPQDEMVYF